MLNLEPKTNVWNSHHGKYVDNMYIRYVDILMETIYFLVSNINSYDGKWKQHFAMI